MALCLFYLRLITVKQLGDWLDIMQVCFFSSLLLLLYICLLRFLTFQFGRNLIAQNFRAILLKSLSGKLRF